MKAIGIFGGTFDPIHIGHLRTAYEILHDVDLEQIRFVPCRLPPHGKAAQAPAELRLEMLSSAVAEIDGFVVDERELNRGGPSYTVDTLESFRQEVPDRPIGLIVGLDAYLQLHTWHRWRDILGLAHVIVARRPGAVVPYAGEPGKLLADRGTQDRSLLQKETAGRILVQAVTQLEISSSAIRDMIAQGRSPLFLLPPEVKVIIDASGCYNGPTTSKDSIKGRR